MSSLPENDKAAIRQAAHRQARARGRRDISAALVDHFGRRFGLTTPRVVAGFSPLSDEPDVLPLLRSLHGQGWPCCLPAVETDDAPLAFRRWAPDAPLARGPLGTLHPEDGAERMKPDIVLVPLLAYDGAGRRLGRGAGFYDRTLGALRARGPVVVLGVAYREQKFALVPEDPHDQRLDAVLTEAGIEDFGKVVR